MPIQYRHMNVLLVFLSLIVCITILTLHYVYAYEQTSTRYGGLVGYRTANFKSDDATFQIWYKITNGTVISTPLDLPTKALIFFVNPSNDGQLIVDLPRSIIDSRNQNSDKPFFVTEHQPNSGVSNAIFSEINDTYVRTLRINFTKTTSEIEIVGNLLAPKYPLSKTTSIASPLWQFKHGTKPNDIQCSSNFKLVFKSKDDTPACVSPENISRLVSIGWAKPITTETMHVEPGKILNDYTYNGMKTETDTIVSINNQTYYQTTLDYSVYNLPKVTMPFHNVMFAFTEGTLVTPGGAFVVLDIKFQDGIEEVYGKHALNEFGGIPVPTPYGPHQAVNSTTILSNHVKPQAGITLFHDKVKLLVSK